VTARFITAVAFAVLTAFGTMGTAMSQVPETTVEGVVTPSGGFTGDVVVGSPDAPVLLVEYASLSCPNCARFHATTYPALKAAYIDTGKVRFVMRDFPLNETAFAAAIVARCGGRENYMRIAELLMATQTEWVPFADWLDRIDGMGVRAGLDPARVDACLKDEALFASINERRSIVMDRHGSIGTPTFTINGQRHRKGTSLVELSQAINDALLSDGTIHR
jgi:protein-disulfide isomerase